jgi:HEPN domain-containing protein
VPLHQICAVDASYPISYRPAIVTAAQDIDPDRRRSASATLLRKAESDLRAARTLAQDPDRFDDAIGFHSQQTVEKGIKAILARSPAGYPRTHDLALLLRKLAEQDVSPPKVVAEAEWLSRWGMRSCYQEQDALLDRRAAIQAAAAAFEWAAALALDEEAACRPAPETASAPQAGTSTRPQINSFERWRQDAPKQRAKIAPLITRFGPIMRDKPRHPAEAEHLRHIGTPDRLIGPEC